jgi:phosphoesterase RecJ-like protein
MVPHINIDGDDLGSMLALGLALERLGKSSYLYSCDEVPLLYRFAPHWQRVTRELPRGPFDAVLFMECPAPGRLPAGLDFESLAPERINIDHHPGNSLYGTRNWVDVSACALGEMMALLIDALEVPYDRDIALWLYVAIATDSGSFQYSNVSARTHRIAARLVEQIGDVSPVNRALYREKPAAELKLLGLVLETLERSPDGRVAWAVLTRDMLSQAGIAEQEAQTLMEEINRVRGAEAMVLFKALGQGKIKVSMRSTGLAVNAICERLGGGGHRQAAAVDISSDDLEAVRRLVLEEIYREMGSATNPI